MREAVGSSPSVSTTSEQAAYRLLRLFSKVRACSFRCSSFSAKSRVRVACSVASALITVRCRYQPFASCVGVSPPAKTVKTSSPQAAYRLRRLFAKAAGALIPQRLLSEKVHAAPLSLSPKHPRNGSLALSTFCGGAGQPYLFHSPLPARHIFGRKVKRKA